MVGVSQPVQKNHKRPFQNLIMPTNIPLIENNFLLLFRFFARPCFKAKIKGDFDEKQMEDFYSSEKMVKKCNQRVLGKKHQERKDF